MITKHNTVEKIIVEQMTPNINTRIITRFNLKEPSTEENKVI